MKAKVIVTAIALVCATLLGSTFAAAAPSQDQAERERLRSEVVRKWGGYVNQQYKIGAQAWATEMAPVFAEATLEELQAAATADNFDSVNSLLLGGDPMKGDSDAKPNALGDPATDLVFVPISPCRLFDTRLAGGQIAANTVRSFDVTAVSDYTFQGGAAGDCNGVGAAGSFRAAAINFTVVTPSGAGYITAFPFLGTQPLAATVNYTAGAIVGNVSLVALDQGASANEVSVYSFAATHLVGDIIGYYINPQATALQCVEVDGTPLNLAAGAAGNAFVGACAAGYTAVETQCRPSIFGMRVAGSWTSHCNMVNDSASAGTVTATARCCRVPGR